MLFWQEYGFAQYYDVLQWVAVFVAVVIAVSCLDDLFIDAYYWVRRIRRSLTVERIYRPLTADQLLGRPEQSFAIMIPAWMESDVIAVMVETMVSVLNFRNYVIFVGTYPNDRATIDEVERVCARVKRVRRVDVGHPGPTCKADCLNAMVKDIFRYERETNVEFAGIVMHDSEDVLHPLELYLFNYLFPRKDMIQLPVVSLERNWYELVAGTYMDEFAEWHAKDLIVRESLVQTVPSAGVGTAFSRRAMLALCEETNFEPFNTSTLTEDYDIGQRLGRLKMKSIFVNFPVRYQVKRLSIFGHTRSVELTMPLAVREFFPDTMRAAYRQKARWILGIALQNWRQMGWPGSMAFKYLLFRDRKSLITSIVSILAYAITFQFLLCELLFYFNATTAVFPSIFSSSPWMMAVLWFNLAALILRVVQRVYFVSRIYGAEQGVLAVPRMIVGNFVNFAATVRAWKQFLQNILWGKTVSWDKTQHVFPTSGDLHLTRRRLGDLLMTWRVLDEGHLSQALALQKQQGTPLGRILVTQGWLDDETLAEALASQSALPVCHLDEAMVRAYGAEAPLACCVHHRAVPFGREADGTPKLAVCSPLGEDELAEFAASLGAMPGQYIARESEITAALRLLVRSVNSFEAPEAAVPLLGDILIAQGLVGREAFETAMAAYQPERDGRIGDHLVARGVVTPQALETGLEVQRHWRRTA